MKRPASTARYGGPFLLRGRNGTEKQTEPVAGYSACDCIKCVAASGGVRVWLGINSEELVVDCRWRGVRHGGHEGVVRQGDEINAMKTYYLQRNVSSTDYEPYRMMIDDHIHDGFKEEDRFEAETWLQAREEFRKRHGE